MRVGPLLISFQLLILLFDTHVVRLCVCVGNKPAPLFFFQSTPSGGLSPKNLCKIPNRNVTMVQSINC